MINQIGSAADFDPRVVDGRSSRQDESQIAHRPGHRGFGGSQIIVDAKAGRRQGDGPEPIAIGGPERDRFTVAAQLRQVRHQWTEV